MKTCLVCLKNKPFSEFYDNISGADGYFTKCKSCTRAYNRLQYLKRKEKKKSQPKQPRQVFFYGSVKPLPPSPDHAIHIDNNPITVHFE